jgi:RNA polymerase sigma-70 factor, ECF subfamily
LPEQELVQYVVEGRREAWEYIAASFYPQLFGYVMSIVKEEESAEELVQDVFVSFWTKRDNIEINISLKAYLFRASRNHALNFIKRKKFEENYHRGLAQKANFAHDTTEETVHFTELQQKLSDAIESLPDSCREIFKLSRFEEMTYKEIAETLDIPIRTVHYQIGLALKELKEKLSNEYDRDIIPLFIPLLVGILFFP